MLAALASASGLAQQPAATADPAASALPYRPLSLDYEPYSEQKLMPWREANDNVGRIGGWRVYAREARQPAATSPEPAPSSAPSSVAPASKDPHAGHHREQ